MALGRDGPRKTAKFGRNPTAGVAGAWKRRCHEGANCAQQLSLGAPHSRAGGGVQTARRSDGLRRTTKFRGNLESSLHRRHVKAAAPDARRTEDGGDDGDGGRLCAER